MQTEIISTIDELNQYLNGNVTDDAILEAFNDLADWGADSIRVGIGGGSICSTRIQTGHGVPTFQSIHDCSYSDRDAKIIADGGIRNSGDIVKALAAGADFVMLGGMLAGHDEGGGEVVNGEVQFYGMSSDTAMKKHNGGVASYRSSEGKTIRIKYRGLIKNTIENILGGVRSACTYIGAKRLKDMPKCATFIRTTQQSNEVFGKNT